MQTSLPADAARDDRKTAAFAPAADMPGVERHADGTVRITSFALARQLLRSDATRQAGFNAELVRRFPTRNVSILFQEGEAHQKQRAAAARFFAPKVVATRYAVVMTQLSELLVERLRREGRAALDRMSLDLAVAVAAEIVGLTDSRRPGMDARLGRFFEGTASEPRGWLRDGLRFLGNQAKVLGFYWLDVRPAIRARRRAPREDVISHLVSQGWTNREILTECLTYAAAGMVTTREFIVMAAWHLLERDDLRARFLAADDAGRAALLEEILRLEPVVGALHRELEQPLALEGLNAPLPAGSIVELDVRAANGDPAAAGACPHHLDPDRVRAEPRGPAALLSFGDGHHRCPGASVALQETAIFLDRLLRVPGIRLEHAPTIRFNPLTTGYELRGAVVAAGRGGP